MAYLPPVIYYNCSCGGVEISPRPGPGLRHGYLESLDYVPDQSSVQTASSGYGIQETNIPLEYATAGRDLFDARGNIDLTASGDLWVSAGDFKDVPQHVQFYPCSPHPGRVAFNLSLQAMHKHEYKSLTGPPYFCRPLGHGMENQVENNASEVLPEVASSLTGGGFSAHFRSPYYQHLTVEPSRSSASIMQASLQFERL